MPLYDYECMKCGSETEVFDHFWKKKDRLRCKCGGSMVSVIKCVSKAKPRIYGEYNETLDAYVGDHRTERRLMQEKGIVEV